MSDGNMPSQTTRNISNQTLHAYKDATDNLMFLRREQVQITFYTWMLLAAIYILSKPATPNAKTFLAAGCIVVGVLSVGLLWSFQSSMQRFRMRLDYIYEKYFDEAERKGLHLDATSRHGSVTWVLIAACAVASLFTCYLVL